MLHPTSQIFTGYQDIFAMFPDFRNLRRVLLLNFPSSVHVDDLVKFFERLPSIETLIWKGYKEKWSLGSIDEVEQWEAHMPIQTRFPGLKTIEIWESHGAELELKFAKLLLERAIVLKEVIIKTTRTCSMDDKERLTKFNVKLLSLPRASSSIKISFQ